MAKSGSEKLVTILLAAAALLIVLGGTLAFISLRPNNNTPETPIPSVEPISQALKSQLDAAVSAGVFLNGIYVDGQHLGGKTMEEAQSIFIQKNADMLGRASLEISGGGQSWQLVGAQEITISDDREAILSEAFAIGRGPSAQQNLDDLESLGRNPREFKITRTYVLADLDNVLSAIGEALDQPAHDAQILGYDSESKQFQFEAETPGSVVDRQALANEIESALVAAQFPAQVSIRMMEQLPEVTQENLKANYQLMAEFSTTAKKDTARNTNIALALEAFNGVVLEPGEEFSMNGTTGERTSDKGYQVAGVILDGASSEDLGGGVCQVSSTLFNAVARAGLEITERHPHSWPSDYIGAGFDAMINFPESDFKFVNNSTGSVYLFSSFDWDTRKLTVQIFGKPIWEEGVTAELTHECVEVIPEPDPIITLDETRYMHEVEVTRNGRSGSRWVTTREFYKDGVKIGQEQLCTSYYRPIASKMIIGTIDDGNFTGALPNAD